MCRKLFFLLAIVLVLSIAGHATADLVAHWKLDDGTGTIAKDSAGSFDGTLLGGPVWATGVNSGGLSFDGTDDCVEIGAYPEFNPSGSFSVAFWANIRDWSTQWTLCPIGIRGDGVGWSLRRFGNWWSMQYPDTYTMPFEVLAFTTRGVGHVGDGVEDSPSNTVPPLNEWIHISCIYDNENNKKYIYFDGVVDAEWNTNAGSVTPATQSLYIGAMSNGGNTGPENFFDGILDDMRYYDHALSASEVQAAMTGIPAGAASGPSPIDGATDVPREVTLSWEPGQFAEKHDVYFGTTFEDVNAAGAGSSLHIGPGQIANTYTPGRLDLGQTYFWRIDEVNAPPDSTVFTGEVWSFTVEPVAYPIPGQNITATASSFLDDEVSQNPGNTVDGSGMTDDVHSKNVDYMWLTAPGATEPGWIQYDFDKVYKLLEMLVWNYNGPPFLNWYGIKDVTVEYSIDGANWTPLEGVSEFAQAPGKDNYAANTIVAFDGLAAKHVRINPAGNWSNGVFTDYGLSEVRFMYIPASAREPSPADEATDIAVDVTLGWRAGRNAAEHNVYFDTDEQAVREGTVPAVTVSQAGHGPLSLDMNGTYYWRVDEVNDADIWQSDIWSFTTQEYLVVDDFESYNDITEDQEGSNLVYVTWEDGYASPTTNGSTMGYFSGNSMETDTVHGGDQSVPLTYDNSVAGLSEVTAKISDLPIGPDWTLGSPEALVLWFHGDPNNAATEQMYMKINSQKIVYDGDSGDIARPQWKLWVIDLASLGVSLNNVTTLTIGFERTGSTGGSGTVFIDDMRLYLVPPVEEPEVAVVNFSFELPGTMKQTNFGGVPGWSTDEPAVDSGVEEGTASDGRWTAYMMGSDGPVWQLTDHTIAEGDVFELTLDARITWQATTLRMTIYYDDNGTRVPAATDDIEITGVMQEYALSFAASDVPASVGRKIGIELDNVTAGEDNWLAVDDVHLGIAAAE